MEDLECAGTPANPDGDQTRDGGQLQKGEHIGENPSDLHSEDIDCGDENDSAHGGEGDFAGAERKEDGKVRRKGDAQCGDSSGVHYHEVGPAVEKPRQSAVGLLKKNVDPAGPRQHRTHFGERECSGERNEASQRPHEQDPERGGESGSDDRRRKEYSRTDRRADRDHRKIEGGQLALEPGHGCARHIRVASMAVFISSAVL
jgi:hypothetical protein